MSRSAGLARRRRSASSSSNSSRMMSGPRSGRTAWNAISFVVISSTTGGVKQGATNSSVRITTRASDAGDHHRSPGRYTCHIPVIFMCVCSTTSSSPRANVMSRCFPFDSTERTTLPTTSKRAASELIRGATISNPVTTRPARARRSTFATRWIVSPSGTSLQVAARRPHEAGGAQSLCDRRLVDRQAVDLVEEERRATIRVCLRRERRGDEPACSCHLVLVAVGEREQRALVACEPRGKDAVDKDDEGAGRPHRTPALRALGPRERGAIQVRGIRRRERHDLRLVARLAHGAQAVDRAGQSELRRAAAGNEVAAAHATRVLHRLEHAVHAGESAGEPLRLHGLPRHDAVPLEQLMNARGDALGRREVRDAERVDERPAARTLLWVDRRALGGDEHRGARRIRGATRRARASPGAGCGRAYEPAQRLERVVRHLAGPDEIPQRLEHLGGEPATEPAEQLREEERAARPEQVADLLMRRAARSLVARLGQEREVLGEEDPDLAVMRAARTTAHPHRGSGREERIEVALLVPAHARGEDARLEIGGWDERTLELRDRIEESALTGARRLEAVPGGREPRERGLLDGLDLAAKARERALPKRAQDAGIDPLEAAPAGPELAFDGRRRVGQLAQRIHNQARRYAEADRELRGAERTVRPRVAADQ